MSPPEPNPAAIGAAYLAASRDRLAICLARIRHCLAQLTDEQIWWRPCEPLNSIGNLVLHLCGNARQWIVAGVSGVPDRRDRPREFAERQVIPKAELLGQLEEVVAQAGAVLMATRPDRLLEPRRIQGFDETVLTAIYDSVAHFQGHTQEIVYVTRLQLGPAYRILWQPDSIEQGAPTGSGQP